MGYTRQRGSLWQLRRTFDLQVKGACAPQRRTPMLGAKLTAITKFIGRGRRSSFRRSSGSYCRLILALSEALGQYYGVSTT